MKILGAVMPIVFLYVFFANTSPISAQQVSPQKAATKTGENTNEQQSGCASVDDEVRLENGKNTGDGSKFAAGNAAKSTGESEEATKNEKITRPEVVGCITSGKATRFPTKVDIDATIGRGESVTVPIRGLYTWANQNGNDPRSLRLFLGGQMLANHSPSLIQVEQGYVKFQLSTISEDGDEKKAWIQILNEARRQPGHEIPISVGVAHKQPFPTNEFIEFEVEPSYSWMVKLSLAGLLLSLILLGWRSDLLRDTSGGRPIPPARAPLSLAKVQMAWWFYLVIAAYLFIWIVTKEINALNATSLTLIGISAGTGLAAIFVDQQKLAAEENTRLALQSEQSTMQTRIAELTHAGPPAAGSAENAELQTRQTRLAEIIALLAKNPAVRPVAVGKGLKDLITDGDGVSFHKFQIVVWTLVLGFVFMRSVARDLVMPDFDTTLLGLMGISSGTYIGFKFPEKPK
jgi:hypothetical protein